MITLLRLEARGLHGLCISELAYYIYQSLGFCIHHMLCRPTCTPHIHNPRIMTSRSDIFHDIVELKFCVVL